MKTKNIIWAFGSIGIIALCMTLLFNDCKKDSTSPGPSTSYGSMAVRLKDVAGNYQQVNVEIQQVSVHMAGGDWINLPTRAGIYNLLVLQNGIDTPLVNTTQLPTGKITQMRLILGTHNTVMVNNSMYPLTVPSGSETGIKLIGNEAITVNQLLVVKLDFNADASVVDSGSTYLLKPTIQVVP
jgi:hypothetical protein